MGPHTQLRTLTRPPFTRLQSLYLLLQPTLAPTDLDLLSRLDIHITSITKKLPLTLRPLLLFIYSHGPRTMGRLTHSRLIYNILGQTTLRLDPLQFTLYALHIAFTIQFPKMWASSPKAITRGIHCPTGPQHNHRDSSQVTHRCGETCCQSFAVHHSLE